VASTSEIVKCLIDHGARLIARLVDGRTALHLAAARGDSDIVKALMDKSLANEEEEDEKETARKAARVLARSSGSTEKPVHDGDESDSEASEITLGSEDSDDSHTMGSFVKVDREKVQEAEVYLTDRWISTR
jgi:ankyrin repeat protein